MSHSVQFHTSSIPLWWKSSWKIKRNITIRRNRYARQYQSLMASVHYSKNIWYATLVPPQVRPGLSSLLISDFSQRITRLESLISLHKSSPPIYVPVTQSSYIVKSSSHFEMYGGVQSRHGTFGNYSRSRLFFHLKRNAILKKLYAVSILTL